MDKLEQLSAAFFEALNGDILWSNTPAELKTLYTKSMTTALETAGVDLGEDE